MIWNYNFDERSPPRVENFGRCFGPLLIEGGLPLRRGYATFYFLKLSLILLIISNWFESQILFKKSFDRSIGRHFLRCKPRWRGSGTKIFSKFLFNISFKHQAMTSKLLSLSFFGRSLPISWHFNETLSLYPNPKLKTNMVLACKTSAYETLNYFMGLGISD